MAKRQRDYRAEEQRRNELARQRGYSTRASERGARQRGDYVTGGYASHAEYLKARESAQSWSDLHSKDIKSRFNSRWKADRVREYENAYDVTAADRRKTARLNKLAAYLHKHYPEDYPDVTNKKFWNNY